MRSMGDCPLTGKVRFVSKKAARRSATTNGDRQATFHCDPDVFEGGCGMWHNGHLARSVKLGLDDRRDLYGGHLPPRCVPCRRRSYPSKNEARAAIRQMQDRGVVLDGYHMFVSPCRVDASVFHVRRAPVDAPNPQPIGSSNGDE